MNDFWNFLELVINSPLVTKIFLLAIVVGMIWGYNKIMSMVIENHIYTMSMDKGFEEVIANGKGEEYAKKRDAEYNRRYERKNNSESKFTLIK